ncbi:endonuclease [Nocardioides sp. JQ2195]|uniref:endonuclease n=1 Tax=Nocardioides sp. JQ2195 TaxID=2592334 RepID=UPI00143E700C|nr:endonuclease [Nocardioides sp. JQ2195]QIX27264.1 endonuclease [Nocardioides sp. JQ2195]
MAQETQRQRAERLIREHGTTYAAEAGITLRDKPSPLYQLLVLTTLSATRISADIAVAAARELFAAGWRTPEGMRKATWQQRVDALGRGHYRRYDESTSTALSDAAAHLLDEYDGDLRRIRPESHDDVPALRDALTGFPRIGPTGADIFCREVQEVWPEVCPFFDKRALRGAAAYDLPTEVDRLAELAPAGRMAQFSAALARVA